MTTDKPPHIFLDCDGVLADFDRLAKFIFGLCPRQAEDQLGSARFWKRLEDHGSFYRDLPLMPGARELYNAVAHLKPTILTGCPRGGWAEPQKKAWAREHFPDSPIITCRSANKIDHIEQPGDVLIDDWPQYRARWIAGGGHFISHYDTPSTLATLDAIYPGVLRTDDPGHKVQAAIAKYGKPNKHGHVTRFSDSSLYDEKCVLCGMVDGSLMSPRTETINNTDCPKNPPKDNRICAICDGGPGNDCACNCGMEKYE